MGKQSGTWNNKQFLIVEDQLSGKFPTSSGFARPSGSKLRDQSRQRLDSQLLSANGVHYPVILFIHSPFGQTEKKKDPQKAS